MSEQSFTACMPLLMATSAFRQTEDARVVLNGVTYTVSILHTDIMPAKGKPCGCIQPTLPFVTLV